MKVTTIKIHKIPHGQLIKKITSIANKYLCDIEIIVGTTIGNVKSPISFLSTLSKVKLPCNIMIKCSNWKDESKAIVDICQYFN